MAMAALEQRRDGTFAMETPRDPRPGATVVVLDGRSQIVSWLNVNTSGQYTSGGLPSGTYRVWTMAGSGGYVAEVYDNIPWVGWPWYAGPIAQRCG